MSTQLGAQDAQFLFLQAPDMPMVVMNIDVFDPSTARGRRVRLEDLVAHFSSRCMGAQVYRRKLFRVPGDLDYPYWIDDPAFRAENHVTRVRLPRPGDWAQLCRLATRRFAAPMDFARPLWDLLVVEGVDALPGVAPGSFALMQRFHHAAIDGASGAHALAMVWDADARGTPLIEPDDHAAPSPAPPPLTVVARALATHAAAPLRVASVLWRESPALLEAAKRRIGGGRAPAGSPIPVTRFNQRLTGRRAYGAARLPLSGLQAIRAAVDGATVNDVILAVCGGALRDYLVHHGELPDASLVAVAPINARGRRGGTVESGNDISAMRVPLATSEADPLARLAAVRRCTVAAKAGQAGLAERLVADLGREVPSLPLAGLSWLLRSERIARSQANLVVTNVPSSRQPLYMCGARLVAQFGMGPVTHGLGLFISANGYHDTIAICLTADAAQVPDVEFLGRCVERSYDELSRAAGSGRRRKPASRAKPKSKRR